MQGGPEAVARAAEVAPDGGGVEAGVDAGEEDEEVFRNEIRDKPIVSREELGSGGFPRTGLRPIHKVESQGSIMKPRISQMTSRSNAN
jgi:hypothetical protein